MNERFGSDNDQNLVEILNRKEFIDLGSRSVEEIADRFSQKSKNLVTQSDGEMIVKLIRSFLSLNGKLEEFPKIFLSCLRLNKGTKTREESHSAAQPWKRCCRRLNIFQRLENHFLKKAIDFVAKYQEF